jgi:tryptophanyl-tRNA synthetase
MAFKERVFSGVQPTGNLHLGNYLGAIVKFVALQQRYDCIYCVVDLHAITVPINVWGGPDVLRQSTREVTAAFIASGIDPKKHIVFNQSQVSGHAELAWVFNCVARMGWLSRMTQFKEKAGKDRENASVGLFAYPSLMAADILVYRATHVPVGEDQKQHLELCPRARLRRSVLSAHRAVDPGPRDARHEPARRHQEDVQVRSIGLFTHQPDR